MSELKQMLAEIISKLLDERAELRTKISMLKERDRKIDDELADLSAAERIFNGN